MSSDLVVARYNENIADMVARELQSDTIRKVFVYDKSDPSRNSKYVPEEGDVKVEVEALPNIGREAHTFLHHIVTRYDDLADLTIFVQGNPYDHLVNFLHYMRFEQMVDFKAGGALPPHMSILNETQTPQHSDRVDTHSASVKVLGKKLESYRFSPGAQYAVPRAAIHRRELDWWRRVLEMIVEDEVNAWEMERLWMYMFGFEDLP